MHVIGERGGKWKSFLLSYLLSIYSETYLSVVRLSTHIHTRGVEVDEKKEERKDELQAHRKKELSERQGRVVSLVVVEVTQLTLLAQVKFQTFEHCSKYGTGYMQVSVITLANVYLTWYSFQWNLKL